MRELIFEEERAEKAAGVHAESYYKEMALYEKTLDEFAEEIF